MEATEAPLRRQETPRTPEHLGFQPGLEGLQVRLLLEGNALNPRTNIPPVEPGVIRSFAVRASERDGAYELANLASRKERQEYWQRQEIQGFDAQKQAWVESTAAKFQNHQQYFEQTEKGKSWKRAFARIGINTEQFGPQQTEQLYNAFFTREAQESATQRFVTSVLNGYRSPENGTVDYETLHRDLDAWQWFSRMYGDKSSQINAQLLDAEAKLVNPQQRDALIQQINAQETKEDGQQTTRGNNLRPKERELLTFLGQYGHTPIEATGQTPPQPAPTHPPTTDGGPRPDGTPPTPDREETFPHPDWQKLKDSYRFDDSHWKNAAQIRKIVAPSEVMQKDLPVYYPGAAFDIEYPLALSDGDNFVFTDYVYINKDGGLRENHTPDESIRAIGGTIKSINIEGELGKGGKRVIVFDWGGKERKVTMYAEDATKFTPSELANGVSVVVIKAPTPFPRSSGEPEPGYIMKSLPDIYRNVAVGGFIHWESVDYLEPETIGFQKLLNTPPTDDYRYKYKNGYPLYQKTRDEPQISELINLDRNLSTAVYTRDGAMTLSITDQTLNDFDTLLRDVRTNYEMLPDDKRREVNPTLIKTLVPQQLTDEQKADIMRYGRAYGLTNERKVQEYVDTHG